MYNIDLRLEKKKQKVWCLVLGFISIINFSAVKNGGDLEIIC